MESLPDSSRYRDDYLQHRHYVFSECRNKYHKYYWSYIIGYIHNCFNSYKKEIVLFGHISLWGCRAIRYIFFMLSSSVYQNGQYSKSIKKDAATIPYAKFISLYLPSIKQQ